jgi:signal transduction histidine kinase
MEETKPDAQLPLPERQFRWYAIFFQVLMFGALVGAVAWILWNTRAAPGWREGVVLVLLLVQIGLFLGTLVFAKQWPVPRKRLLLYYALNLGIWFVEFLLVPQIFWVGYAYIGQMFGLLPTRYGLGAALVVSLIVFGGSIEWQPKNVTLGAIVGIIAAWATMFFMAYLSHLSQTSQERGRLIAELEVAKVELEAAQQREAELAVLHERERLARDLHDSLGHALVALSVQLEAVQRLYRVDPEQASAQVDEMKALTRSSMDALRRSLAGLRAPGLGDSALRPALQALCVDFGQRTGVEITCRTDETANLLGPALAEAVWRVAQEALTNVGKHAQAKNVQVSLQSGSRSVVLRVSDDGIGLPEGAERSPNCFGLRGMRERVEGLGGTLTLKSSAEGAVVQARLPIIAAAEMPQADAGQSATGA